LTTALGCTIFNDATKRPEQPRIANGNANDNMNDNMNYFMNDSMNDKTMNNETVNNNVNDKKTYPISWGSPARRGGGG